MNEKYFIIHKKIVQEEKKRIKTETSQTLKYSLKAELCVSTLAFFFFFRWFKIEIFFFIFWLKQNLEVGRGMEVSFQGEKQLRRPLKRSLIGCLTYVNGRPTHISQCLFNLSADMTSIMRAPTRDATDIWVLVAAWLWFCELWEMQPVFISSMRSGKAIAIFSNMQGGWLTCRVDGHLRPMKK